ncbi:type IV pilus modification PilV family protein [Streptomyces zagrosensis]|uniref:Proline rich protein membrane protein n=1 Tax=Streptomyces zagrosensis TaxID=1042984 RepID=A0A7W9QGQ9_9ACTN|nr:hypothetical protein [Streptomyces zagrosensis]MBB5939679.1 hypothetical protein [Streptomyces zagrosensis]
MSARAIRRGLRRWLWRWRRNPLRRRTDVIEAWTVLLTAVIMVVGGAALGATTAVTVQEPLMEQHEHRHQTQAELVKDVPARPTELGDPGVNRVHATVRWTTPDGATHTGKARVEEGRKAGARVTVWTDARGELTSTPLSPEQATTRAAVLGAMAATGFGCVTLIARHLVQRRLERDRNEQWECAWAEIGPKWSGRV